MRRLAWVAVGGVVVLAGAVVFVTVVMGVPLSAIPTLITGGDPGVGDAEGGFDHQGEAPYRFQAYAENLTKCGPTCRNFTGRMEHRGDSPTRNVRLDIGVLANGSQLWQGNRTVGRMAPGETYDLVQEADVGFSGASKVLENDGNVTVRITVRYDGGSETMATVLKAA